MTLQQAMPTLTKARFQVTLQRGEGSIAKTGVLTIDEEQLIFKGVGGLARLTGAGALRQQRHDLERVELLGTDGPLALHFGPESSAPWTISGGDVLDLAELLDTTASPPAPVLVEGTATVTVGGAPPSFGTLRLTSARLEFRAEGDTQNALDIEWSAVTDGHIKGLRAQYHCAVAGVPVKIEGDLDLVGALASHLTALPHSSLADSGASQDEHGLVRWPACRRHGALAIQGELVVGRQHLEFVPKGIMERTLGIKGVVVPYKHVLRAVVHGWGRRKLSIVTRDARETFTLDHIEERFEQLLELYHEGHQSFMAQSSRQRRAVAKILDRWSDSVPVDSGRIIEAQPVVQRVDRLDFSVGVLVQTADVVQYYPAGGPKGPACAESHPVPRILRRYGGLAPDSPVIAFEESSRSFSYLPSAGAAFTQRFWDRCRAPSRIVHLDMPARRTVERVLGPARFRRVRTADGRSLELDQMYQEGMAWIGTLTAGDLKPAVGQQVSVDVGQPDGVYRFETDVMDIDDGDNKIRIFLTRPKTIRVYNQRRTYRVPVDITARAHVHTQSRQTAPLLAEDSLLGPDAHRLGALAGLDLQLSDLSLGGCAAAGSVDLPVGSTLELELDLKGRTPLRVRGRVLRADAPSTGALRRFGIRFEDLRQSTERELQRHVLAAQRHELNPNSPIRTAAAL